MSEMKSRLMWLMLFAAFCYGHYYMPNLETFVVVFWWIANIAGLFLASSKAFVEERLARSKFRQCVATFENFLHIGTMLYFGYVYLPLVIFLRWMACSAAVEVARKKTDGKEDGSTGI